MDFDIYIWIMTIAYVCSAVYVDVFLPLGLKAFSVEVTKLQGNRLLIDTRFGE